MEIILKHLKGDEQVRLLQWLFDRADVLTMGANKFVNEQKFFTEKKIDDIVELLNE